MRAIVFEEPDEKKYNNWFVLNELLSSAGLFLIAELKAQGIDN
jgi:hypothetical protein